MEEISEQTREKHIQHKKFWTRKYQEGIPKKVSKSFSTESENKSKETIYNSYYTGSGRF